MWWRSAQRYRLPTRPLSHRHSKREETRKRQAWTGYRSWSRLTSGVLRHVIGAVQYGTARGLDKIVPHFDAQDFRQYRHHILAIFAKPGKAVVMVVDRSGLQRAGQLASTLAHDDGQVQLHLLPARCGHPPQPHRGLLACEEGRHRRRAVGA